ncbi:porin [Burkholderia multivorans]|uniref:porin n=1 Tax=Burkholderia multivorans TaxID=87883 RepID=UPI002019E24B|nr:porin [Burkholderia multivorans]UQP02850.1 porin [Burkholderia multivorans]
MKSIGTVFIYSSTVFMGLASQASHAQNSVTLYGTIDNSLQYVHNVSGKSYQLSLQSGQLTGSNWGLKGNEDLGGGLSAIFKLESGFDVNSGAQTSSGFGRSAYVGLKSETFGTVTLGRQYDPLFYMTYAVQPNSYLYYFTTPGNVDNSDGLMRLSSSVQYASPDFHGFQLRAAYALGGVAGSVGSGQSYGLGLSYSAGAWNFGGGYLHVDNGNSSTATRGTTDVKDLIISPVNSAYATASKINIARAGASFSIDSFTFGGYYSYTEYLADATSTFRQAERYNNGNLYAVWRATPATTFEIGYNLLKSHGDTSATYHQVSLAGDYALSKRTDVYASVSYVHASGQNGNGEAQAVVADSYAAAGSKSQEFAMVGIRHRF